VYIKQALLVPISLPSSSIIVVMPPNSQEEPLKRLAKVVNSFLARPDSGPFREPVDWRGLELWDYPQVINNKMMDLGSVKRKLERSRYATAAAAAADIRLVWKNCMTYNAEGSDFWLLAKAFSKRFEDRYRKVKAECKFTCDCILVVLTLFMTVPHGEHASGGFDFSCLRMAFLSSSFS
jgi:Bromodomain